MDRSLKFVLSLVLRIDLDKKGWRFVVAFFFAIHLGLICFYLLDVPVMDEWDIWYGWKTKGFFPWLFARHNEHIVLPTRIHLFLVNLILGGHPKLYTLTGFLIYGSLIYALFRFSRWALPNSAQGFIWPFLFFLVSTHSFENFRNGFHSVFHFVLLFLVIAIPYFFGKNFGPLDALIGIIFCGLMMVSYSTGIGQSLALASVALVYRFRERSKSSANLIRMAGTFGIVCLMAAYWITGHSKPDGHPNPLNSMSKDVLIFFLNLVAYGFGVDSLGFIWGVLCLILLITPLYLLRKELSDPKLWALIAGIAGVLAALSTISYGRTPFGIHFSKLSRYGEIGIMLVPFAACLWARALPIPSPTRSLFFNTLWLTLFLTFLNNWSLHPYGEYRRLQQAGRECLRLNLLAGRYQDCGSLYPFSLAEHLKRMKDSDAEFLRDLRS